MAADLTKQIDFLFITIAIHRHPPFVIYRAHIVRDIRRRLFSPTVEDPDDRLLQIRPVDDDALGRYIS